MTSCTHLEEIRSALAAGHWPHAVAPELRSHAANCSRCSQEILLTTHFQQSRADAIASAQPGSPSLLWWRAQLRRRNAALASAGRPIAAAQIFAFSIALFTLGAIVVGHWAGILHLSSSALQQSLALSGDWSLPVLLVAIALVTTLGSVALYLSSDRR